MFKKNTEVEEEFSKVRRNNKHDEIVRKVKDFTINGLDLHQQNQYLWSFKTG
jgi:hypothetical protein